LADDVRIEAGADVEVGGPAVAVVAQWSPGPYVMRSTAALVGALDAAGYQVVVSSSCEADDALDWDQPLPDGVVVLRRPNVAYDFGSWSAALGRFPAIAAADRVLLVNDSMAGPFRPLGPVLDAFAASPADAWSLTDSDQFGHHLQSYFLGFRRGVLARPALARFWAGIRHHDDKMDIIFQNELGLSALLRDEGCTVEVAFPYRTVVDEGENPVIIGWRRLLEAGFPFLKREILRDPSVAPDGDQAAAVVEQLTGCVVADWVGEVRR
jgi:hypothetical protein